MSILPPEVLGHIFLSLADDKSSLGACTLVCEGWTYTAQRLLFAELRIELDRYADVRRSLQSSVLDRVASFVRILWISLDGAPGSGAVEFDPEQAPLLLAKTFRTVHTLGLESSRRESDHHLQRLSCWALSFPLVKALKIMNGNFTNIHQLTHAPFMDLTHLSLHGRLDFGSFTIISPLALVFEETLPPEIRGGSRAREGFRDAPLQLESLDLGPRALCAFPRIALSPISRLHSVRLMVVSGQLAKARMALAALPSCVQHLHLVLGWRCPGTIYVIIPSL
jgi:hypothetical protein